MIEKVYEKISSCLIQLAPNEWGSINLKTTVLHRRCGGLKIEVFDKFGNEVRPKILWDAINQLDALLVSLRDGLLDSNGDRIWGVTFALESSGKFKIEYSYDKPEWYDEDDEKMSSGEKNESSLGIGATGSAVGVSGQGSTSSDSDAALAWLREATLKHSAQWALGKEANWNLDLNAGQLRWTFSDGRVVHADIQVIGTFNTKNDSFLWGWEHPSVPQPLRRAAIAAQAWGEANGIADFTIRNPHCSEDRTWVFAAIAAQQDGASGVYRGNANGTWVYVAFSEPGVEPSSEA